MLPPTNSPSNQLLEHKIPLSVWIKPLSASLRLSHSHEI